MKKCLVTLLVLAMVFSMSGAVFAVENGTYMDGSPVKIDKVLTINNPGTINPQETFNFTVGAGSGMRGAATITAPVFSPATFSITVSQGATTGLANIGLPNFTEVGVYRYPLTETAGNTAGMDYDGVTYYLVVTVINNPDFGMPDEPEFLRVLTLTDGKNVKRDSFVNDFDAGNLTINKIVTGNYGDPNDEFTVTVTLTPIEGKVLKADPILASGGSKVVNPDGSVTITYTVKKGSTYTINNVPYDVNYSVVESANTLDYTASYVNASGLMDAATETTTITNNRNKDILTGINLDNLPYLILLVFAIGGLAVFAIKKRLSHNS